MQRKTTAAQAQVRAVCSCCHSGRCVAGIDDAIAHIVCIDVSEPNSGNGGETECFTWTQTLSELIVKAPVRVGIRGKHMNVNIRQEHIVFGIKGESAMRDAKLHKRIKVDDSFWTLETEGDDKFLIITLCKQNQVCASTSVDVLY